MKRWVLIDPTIDDQVVLIQELRQAKVRCVVTGLISFGFVAVTISFSKYQNVVESGEVFKVLGSLLGMTWGLFQILLFKFHKNIRPSAGRILVGQFADALAVSLALSAGDVGAMCFVGFLWIILGNGMRFGRRLLITCQVLCLGIFSLSVAITPYWHKHIELAISFIIILILIPAYFGALVNRLGQIRDKLIEKEKAQVGLLKQMDNLKTTFFANISHEFRTPIALTLGSLDMLERNPEDMQKQIPIVRRNQNRLLQLINQILDLEKMEQGGLDLKFSPLGNLDLFIQRRAEQFQAMAVKKSLTLNVDANTKLKPGEIYVDPDNFDKVIFNLLSNAFKFTKSGGVTISVQIANNKVEIRVIDSGMGIREDQLPIIFDRFRQATGSESKDYAGTGIGLSLVQEIVRLHGGEIQVESQYGKGTAFIVSLPLGKSHLNENQINPNVFEEGETSKQQFDSINEGLSDTSGIEEHKKWNENCFKKFDSHKKTILYVDDNYDLRAYLINLLGNSYNLILAWDGIAALEILEKHVPDLILSDLMMPRLDGSELIKRIRQNPDLRDIPFVILTAKAMESTKFDLLDAGADDFLFKPFSREELLVRVRNLLILRENSTQARHALLEAKKIQRSLLPPIDINLESLAISVLYKPCDTLSGDFYDVLVHDHITLCYVADVTSHGTSAAQVTYLIKSTLKSLFEEDPSVSVGEVLKTFTKRYVDFKLDYGVAIQIFKYDSKSRKMTFSSSNSPTPFYQSPTGDKPLTLGTNPLIDAEFFKPDFNIFKEDAISFNPGDVIFFFTDGCIELKPKNGRDYSERQFYQVLKKINGHEDWREVIIKDLSDQQGSEMFADDVTIMRLIAK